MKTLGAPLFFRASSPSGGSKVRPGLFFRFFKGLSIDPSCVISLGILLHFH